MVSGAADRVWRAWRRLTAGLIHPTTLFPAAMRASLIAATNDAKMGADADVPLLLTNLPP